MPLWKKDGKDGPYWVRPPFDAANYRVPDAEIRDLEKARRDSYPTEAMLDERDGPFANWEVISRFTRDGKPWVLLYRITKEYCVEVELVAHGVGEIVPVSPERAWQVALKRDQGLGVKIVHEPR